MENKGIENLKPAKKGEIRNPGGKPKGTKNIKTILKKYLSIELEKVNPLTENKEKMTTAELLQLKKIAMALGGNVKCMEMIDERLYGKVEEKVNHSGEMKITDLKDIFADLAKQLKDEPEKKE